ncbi:hypothetical protein PV08_07459 [Exophiala spinifera]|uniref:Uncharacterized protein n=1 Tax=Exophiala spinifera TaxID=91928 RepID=A0A0D2B7L4_9EURO|nr:uncharacterized protein PV08_07459 [Exophiala spinifera]KIW14675.1 hypothetical protein PV08_07459 [Exophiala spinifera]
MGCGQSSLKGDDVPHLNSQLVDNRPIKKIQTNFSDINYDQDPQQQRRMTEYAPNETPREYPPVLEHDSQDAIHEADATTGSTRPPGPGAFGGGSGAGDGLGRDASYPHQSVGDTTRNPIDNHAGGQLGHDVNGNDNNALKPYQTFDGTDWDNDNFQNHDQKQSQGHQQPNHDQTGNPDGYDPTSRQAKREFAHENDPATPHPRSQGADEGIGHSGVSSSNNNNGIVDASNPQQHKNSWLGQKYASFQASKSGPGVKDEDLRRYTGKDRAEFDEWAKTHPGVGARQPANDTAYTGGGGGFAN